MSRREDHEVQKGPVVALDNNNNNNILEINCFHYTDVANPYEKSRCECDEANGRYLKFQERH
jgi:hypothetical protein